MHDMKVVLDFGNGYIKGVIFGKEEGNIVILAKEMIKTKGMRKGKILDVEEFAVCINKILESFSRKLGEDVVDRVIIGISHPTCSIRRISEQKRVLTREITHDDIGHLSEIIADSGIKPNYEVLKIIPVQRIIDEQTKVKDPIGMEARKLELIADVFMIPKNFYQSLFETCERLDLHIVDIVPNILGSIEACLDLDSRDLGVLLVDIGSNQTSYVVYEEGFPVLYGVLPIGGEEVTKDISIGLQIDIKDAERIKREKGTILLGNHTAEEGSIDMSFLSDIMIARYEEILELINDDLTLHDRDGRLPAGVLFTGGAVKVEGLLSLAKDVFKLASFQAKAKNIDVGDLSSNLQFMSLLGDYTWVEKYENQTGRRFNLNLGASLGLLKKVGAFFKELF